MGNKLTVANATDNDIYAKADVTELDLKSASAKISAKAIDADLSVSIGSENVPLGLVAIGPKKLWTFPMMVFGRYFLTVTKKGWTEPISNGIQVPWHTNIIVTPDNKLGYAKSGTVWIDASDDTNYAPTRKRLTANNCVTVDHVDGIDGDDDEGFDEADNAANMLSSQPHLSLDEAAAQLKRSADVPLFVSRLIIAHCFEHGTTDINEIDEHIEAIMTALKSSIKSSSAHQPLDEKLLRELLEKFDLDADVVDRVIRELLADDERTEETAKLVRHLAAADSDTPPASAAAAAGPTASSGTADGEKKESEESYCSIL